MKVSLRAISSRKNMAWSALSPVTGGHAGESRVNLRQAVNATTIVFLVGLEIGFEAGFMMPMLIYESGHQD